VRPPQTRAFLFPRIETTHNWRQHDCYFHNIPHNASSLTIDFFADGPGFQGNTNESWGMDNLQVVLNGTTSANFTVTLSQPSTTPVTVDVATVDGTAISTGITPDFQAIPTTKLTFAPGVTQQTISVPVFNDTIN